MTFLSQAVLVSQRKTQKTLKMQVIPVIVTEKPCVTFCSFLHSGFWVFLKLHFCCNPHVLLILLIVPMVCAPPCCCIYIWSKKLLFNTNPPISLQKGWTWAWQAHSMPDSWLILGDLFVSNSRKRKIIGESSALPKASVDKAIQVW